MRDILLPDREGANAQAPTRIWAGYLRSREDRQEPPADDPDTSATTATSGHMPGRKTTTVQQYLLEVGHGYLGRTTSSDTPGPGDSAPPTQTQGTVNNGAYGPRRRLAQSMVDPDIFEHEQNFIMEAVHQHSKRCSSFE